MTTPCSTTTTPAPRFLLLGDSHAGCIGRAARDAGLPFVGGPVGSGRDFLGPFSDVDGGSVAFRDVHAQRLFEEFLGALETTGPHRLKVPLVCTFGLSAHTTATRQNWDIHRDRNGTVPGGFLRSGLFAGLVLAGVRGALAFYDHTAALGLRVLAPLPPQRVPGMSDPDVFFAAQEVIGAAAWRRSTCEPGSPTARDISDPPSARKRTRSTATTPSAASSWPNSSTEACDHPGPRAPAPPSRPPHHRRHHGGPSWRATPCKLWSGSPPAPPSPVTPSPSPRSPRCRAPRSAASISPGS